MESSPLPLRRLLLDILSTWLGRWSSPGPGKLDEFGVVLGGQKEGGVRRVVWLKFSGNWGGVHSL